MRQIKALFIGSNPSMASTDGAPFRPGTRSRLTLESWIKNLQCIVLFTNVVHYKTVKNRPLSLAQIKEQMPTLQQYIDQVKPDKIVALGQAASKALTLLHRKHLLMPHPSGLNRQLNDKKFIKEKIEELTQYISIE